MDVLVVGGTGIISTGITRRLADAGHDVTIFNRGETDVALPDSVETIRGDRTEYDEFEARMDDADPDYVVDMRTFAPEDAESALRAFAGVERYVFCSTVAVYDQPVPTYPITEDTPRKPPGDDYGGAKRACEDRFREAHRETGFPVTIVRPGHTYGEGGTYGGIAYPLGWEQTYFVERLRAGEPMVVHGDGSALWSSCHRNDVAAAFVAALEREGTVGETYHVPSTEAYTWNEYLRTLAGAVGAPAPELVHVPTELLADVVPGDRVGILLRDFQHSWYYDVSKAESELNFEPSIGLTEGMGDLVDWLETRDRLDAGGDPTLDDRIVAAWRSAGEDFHAAFERSGA